MGRSLGPRMGELRDLVLRDYAINGRVTAWRVVNAFRHLSRCLPDPFPVRDAHEMSARYILARTAEGAKAATILYEIAMLGRALNLAARSKLIESRPLLVRPAVNNARRGFVPRESVRSVLAELEEPVRSIVHFGYITGWRKSEVLGLKWSNVDWETWTIRLEPGTTKNRDGRTYPFKPHRALRRLLERAHLARNGPSVFHRKGKPVRSFRGAWENACRKVELGNTFHDLRRSSVRNYERAGVPRSVAMQLTGHKTESIYRRYAIVNEEDLSRGVRMVARLTDHRKDDAQEAVDP